MQRTSCARYDALYMPAKNEPEGLAAWLKRQKADLTEDGPIKRIDLLHTVEGEGWERLEIFRVRDETDMDDAAQVLWQSAQHDVETRTSGVPQRYIVQAFRNEDSRDPEGVYPFLIRSNTAKMLTGGDTEPPTDKGVISHYMRHDENAHRILITATEGLLGRLASELKDERQKRLEAEATSMQLYKTSQELLDRSSERRVREAKEALHDKFMADLMGVVVAMLPMIASKFLNIGDAKGEFSQLPGAARDLGVRKLLANLSEAEATSLVKSLEPHNQLAFFELYKSYRQDELKEQAQRPKEMQHGTQEESKKAQQENGEAPKVH